MANLLELANMILTGQPITKADAPSADPDNPTPGAMSEDEMAAARTEAQAGQQAQAAANPQGEGGEASAGAGTPSGEAGEAGEAGEGGDPGGEGGQEDPDAGVEKAEILKSMHFLAETYNLTPEEVTKSFSGLEGNPEKGKEPVGKGIEFLEKLLRDNNDVLGRIAGFIQELAGSHVKLEAQVSKSLEAAEVAKSLSESTAQAVAELPRVAAAKLPKAATAEEIVAKAQVEAGSSVGSDGKPKLNGADLFKMALDPKCPLSPQQMAQANRASQGTIGA